ncbi:transmembrane protein, putative (macronuclear) [Tetrahymena thermophila SB210]|uniref:Transmembrane protein, putative n=1 Tax=Tetrahymena thermophila (strain SB210) TaxID=312017 RepID=W7XB85_TETTS|nr:transmembrane protein, putative [Tetrahymena thermophila SB210]EWS70936.1 transmembrane protein, putative [Tetrahymena thermophila SB210]|eukprot:XP_012656551.1 transmembrane protein, putative [Tetrahymena thermophila SB210]
MYDIKQNRSQCKKTKNSTAKLHFFSSCLFKVCPFFYKKVNRKLLQIYYQTFHPYSFIYFRVIKQFKDTNYFMYFYQHLIYLIQGALTISKSIDFYLNQLHDWQVLVRYFLFLLKYKTFFMMHIIIFQKQIHEFIQQKLYQIPIVKQYFYFQIKIILIKNILIFKKLKQRYSNQKNLKLIRNLLNLKESFNTSTQNPLNFLKQLVRIYFLFYNERELSFCIF